MNQLTAYSVILSVVGAGLPLFPVLGQVTAHDANTTVISGPPIEIRGGTLGPNSENLFHDFAEFNPGNSEVQFENVPGVERIFGRVINGSESFIDGRISTLNSSNIDIFLINPSGIRFGENASLDANVSFVGSTATSIEFPDGSFSALNDDSPNLLVNIPTGLRFTGTPGQIRVEGAGYTASSANPVQFNTTTTLGIQAQPNQTLALIGGGIEFDGGNILTNQGRVELGSVGTDTTVGIVGDLNFDYSAVNRFGNIELMNRASIDASGVAGGEINLQGQQINLSQGSIIVSNTRGSGVGQNISITASEQLLVDGFAADSSGVSRPSMIMTKNTFSNTATGSSGDVTVNAPHVSLTNGGQIWTGTVRNGGEAGDLTVNAQTVEIRGDSGTSFEPSGLYAIVGSNSQGGDVTVTGQNLTIREGGELSIDNSGSGTAGTMRLNLADAITLESNAKIEADANDVGNAGTIEIATGSLALSASSLVARSLDAGQGGAVSVNARQVILSDRSTISTTAFNAGNAGRIDLTATEKLVANGVSVIASQVGVGAIGAGGVVNVDVGVLELSGGSQISTGTSGFGDAGAVTINVAGTATIAGTGINAMGETALSGISSQVNEVAPPDPPATGQGGTVTFKANNLFLREGGNLTAGTLGGGAGGNMTVEVNDTITIDGIGSTGLPSAIAARTRTDQNAGNLSISTNTLQISDQGTVTVESLGSGNAGNLSVNARYIRLNNNASITAETTSGQGGNLELDAMHIILLFDSEISTTAGTAGQPGDGGNITIDAATVTGLFNSDIASNSFQGRGGRIVITAEGIFGLEFRLARTSGNDITAFSQVDPQLNGEVVLNTPDIDPTQALIEVPVVESPEVVRRVCGVAVSNGQEGDGTLEIEGRALPSSPADAPGVGRILLPEMDFSGGGDRPTNPTNLPTLPTPQRSARDRLIAQDMGRNAQGQLALTAQAPAERSVWISAVWCR